MDLSGGGGPGSGTGELGKEDGGERSSGGICNLSAILSDLSCGDRRAPGCEKKVGRLDCIHKSELDILDVLKMSSNIQNVNFCTQVAQIATAADYEQKRLMATKAMHHKVNEQALSSKDNSLIITQDP